MTTNRTLLTKKAEELTKSLEADAEHAGRRLAAARRLLDVLRSGGKAGTAPCPHADFTTRSERLTEVVNVLMMAEFDAENP